MSLHTLPYERLVIGYHGCDREVGMKALLTGTALLPSNNSYDWLGRGVYFWEHGPARALEWAHAGLVRGRIKEPFVLGAFIHLGRCLDLADRAAVDLTALWYSAFAEWCQSNNEPLPQNLTAGKEDQDRLRRNLDCAVINYGLDTLGLPGGTPFQTVRGVFTEGGPAFPGAGLQVRTHVQVAVRDPKCILGFFRPAE